MGRVLGRRMPTSEAVKSRHVDATLGSMAGSHFFSKCLPTTARLGGNLYHMKCLELQGRPIRSVAAHTGITFWCGVGGG